MKYLVLVMMALSFGCDSEKKMTTADKLSVCKTICGRRSIESFTVSFDDHFDCRCGRVECEPVCDGGRP